MIMLKVIVMLRWWLKIYCLYGNWLIINWRCQETHICSVAFSKAKKSCTPMFFFFPQEKEKRKKRCLKDISSEYLTTNPFIILNLVSTLGRQCISCRALKKITFPKSCFMVASHYESYCYWSVRDYILFAVFENTTKK